MNEVFTVAVYGDYADYGVVAIFSNIEKAKEYAEGYKDSCADYVCIFSMQIDEPDKTKDCNYYRRLES